MKVFATMLALTASSAAAYPIALRNADVDADETVVERKLQIDFEGGFNGLCDREVMEDINVLVLSTLNEIMREGKDEAFQFDTVTVDSERLSAISHHGERNLAPSKWQWVSFFHAAAILCINHILIHDLILQFNFNEAIAVKGICSRCYRSIPYFIDYGKDRGRNLDQDTAIEQLEVAITNFLPHFECMNGASDVYVSFLV